MKTEDLFTRLLTLLHDRVTEIEAFARGDTLVSMQPAVGSAQNSNVNEGLSNGAALGRGAVSIIALQGHLPQFEWCFSARCACCRSTP